MIAKQERMSRKDYALYGIYVVRPKGALITVFQSPSWNLLFPAISLWKGTIPHRPIVALGFHYKSCRVLCFVRMGLFPDFPWVPSRYCFARVTNNTHSSVFARTAGATLIPHCLFADCVRRGSLIITYLIGVKIHFLPYFSSFPTTEAHVETTLMGHHLFLHVSVYSMLLVAEEQSLY